MAASAEIIAKIGLDTATFEQQMARVPTMVERVDAQLKKIGIGSASGKSAKESAAAYEEIFAAEEKLAAAQARRTLESGAGFRREIILQREILALRRNIDSMQGQTLAKVEAQLLLEQKLLQLESAISAQKVTQAATTGGVGSGVGALNQVPAAAARATGALGQLGGMMSKLFSLGNVLKAALGSIGIALVAPKIADLLARLVTGFSAKDEKRLEELGAASEQAFADQQKMYAARNAAREKAAAAEQSAFDKQLSQQDQLNEARRAAEMENLSVAGRLWKVKEDIADLEGVLSTSTLTNLERERFSAQLQDRKLELISAEQAVKNQIRKQDEEAARDAADEAARVAKEQKEAADEAKRYADELARAEKNAAAAKKEIQSALSERGTFSLSEAASGKRGTATDMARAQAIIRAEAEATQLRESGNKVTRFENGRNVVYDSAMLFDRAAALRREGIQNLSASDKDPYASLKAALVTSENELKAIKESLKPTVIK